MILHQLKFTLRQFKRQKAYVLINYIGLTVGLATALLIGKFVLNEWTADGFIPEPDRTFRLVRTSEINLEPYKIGVTSAPFATALEADYPDDVEATTRVLKGNSVIAIGDQVFEEENYLYVDPNFVTFFNLPLLHGDAENALSEANRVILSKKTAEKYFGSAADVLGKTLRIDNSYDAIISGVFDELGYQSHLEIDLIESNQLLYNRNFWTQWWNNSLVTYVRLNLHVSAQNFNARLPDFMEKYFGDDFKRMGAKVGLELEAVGDIYFAGDTRYDPVQHGNRSGVFIFLFAAILLVVVACINYINLSTATAITRSREMAIHKVLGSGKGLIIKKMLLESSVLTTISLTTATYLAYLAIPWFENLLDTSFKFQLPVLETSLFILGLGVVVSLFAGFYPGLLMASFQPKSILKNNVVSRSDHTTKLRKGLVVFQYALSTVLLCSTFVIHQQMEYLKTKDLGFNEDHVLIIRTNNREINNQSITYKNELLRDPGIKSASFMNGEPGGFHDATSIDIPSLAKSIRMRTAFVDFDYVNTFGIELIAGRDLNADLSSDSTQSVLLNERAVKDIGLATDEIIGQTLYMSSFDTIPKNVVGVLRDYHFTSLHDKIEPLIVSYAPRSSMIAIKASSDRIQESIAHAEAAWSKIVPAYPFNYSFLDERLESQYNNELRQGRIFTFFAVIAIFIACLGIFGLAAFAASTRKKEIGVRKVLGASVLGIVGLLSKDFLKLVLLASIIAIPFAWYLMQEWLSGFAYKVEISQGVFLVAGLIGLVISLLTVSYQSIRAAVANPVDSLRDE